MTTYERVADGRRKFFPVPARPTAVFLRDKRGHHDRALEPGRDFEIEASGVAMRRVPAVGETVVIMTGDRSRKNNGDKYPARDETLTKVSPLASSSAESPPQFEGQSVQSDDVDLMALKDMLTLAARDHCEGRERTAAWQDEFARLTAILRKARDTEGVLAAFRGLEQFLLEGAI